MQVPIAFQTPTPPRHAYRWHALRRAWEFARSVRLHILGYLLLSVLSAALAVVPPLIYQFIVDHALAERSVRRLLLSVFALLAVTALAAASSFFATWIGQVAGARIVQQMRMAIFTHVQAMPLAFFARVQSGKLMSRVTNDVTSAQELFTTTLGDILTNTLTVLITMTVILRLNWLIGVAALGLGPVLLGISELAARRSRRIVTHLLNDYGDMFARMTERFNVGGAMLVKLFDGAARERNTFQGVTGGVARRLVQLHVVTGAFVAASSLIVASALIAVYGLGGWGVINRSLTLGTLVALATLVQRLYAPMVSLAQSRIMLAQQLVAVDRVLEITDLPPAIVDRPDAPALLRPQGGIELDHVWFRFPAPSTTSLASLEADDESPLSDVPSEWILHDVCLTMPAGTMTALVGHSGGGKTTLASLIPRFYDVSEGAVRIDGVDVRDVTLASLAANIGVVSQEPFLFHDTVAENLRYARSDATDDEIRAACRSAHLAELIESLPEGYDTMVGDRGYRFSGGERQRLAIARVFLRDPAVVILDEATSHLDSETEALVQAALQELLAGRTSLVIAHRLSTVLSADQIVVMSAGRVVQRGTHEVLSRTAGLYAELCAAQFMVAADGAPGRGV